MKAILLNAVEQMCVQDVVVPVPGDDEVLIKVKAAGLCGSDFHIYHGTYPAVYPLIQGHEFSGVIEKVGEKVTGWKTGQRVTVDPNIYCHHCYYCLKSQENMCENAQASGVTRNGAFAEYVTVPASQLYELPETVSFEEGALIEPLACAIYGVKRLQPEYGGRAVIFGAGPMGLLLLKALNIAGMSQIAVVDLDPVCLKRASEMGAAKTFCEIGEVRKAYLRGFDVVVDATGSPKVIEQMFSVAAKRARILQFGCANTDTVVPISPYQIYANDWTYIGTCTAVHTYAQAIDLVSAGKIRVKDVISQVVSMETLAEYLAQGKPAGTMKIVMKPDGAEGCDRC